MTMQVAYCRDCGAVIATVPPAVKGAQPPTAQFRHVVKSATHVASLVTVEDTPMQPKESPAAYLERLAKVHKKSLK